METTDYRLASYREDYGQSVELKNSMVITATMNVTDTWHRLFYQCEIFEIAPNWIVSRNICGEGLSEGVVHFVLYCYKFTAPLAVEEIHFCWHWKNRFIHRKTFQCISAWNVLIWTHAIYGKRTLGTTIYCFRVLYGYCHATRQMVVINFIIHSAIQSTNSNNFSIPSLHSFSFSLQFICLRSVGLLLW